MKTRPILAKHMTDEQMQIPEDYGFLSPIEERHIDYILEEEFTTLNF